MPSYPYAFSSQADQNPRRELDRVLEKISRRLSKLPRQSSADGLHETRTLLKLLRALLWLVDSDLPPTLSTSLKNRLRTASRKLSAPRDASVIRSTLEQLAREASHPKQETAILLASARLDLDSSKANAKEHRVWRAAVASTQRTIQDFRRQVNSFLDWQFPGERLKKAFRSMEEARRAALKKRTADDFHAWRKKAKRLFYLLQVLTPNPERKSAKLIHQLSKIQHRLGDHHDTAILEARLRKEIPAPADRKAVEPLFQLVRHQQRRLCRKTEKVARRIGRA